MSEVLQTIKMALKLAKIAHVGVELTYRDVIELLGYIESIERTASELIFEQQADEMARSQ